MFQRIRAAAVSLALVAGVVTLGGVTAAPASASTTVLPGVVSAVPAATTPQVKDGSVLAIAQVGSTVVIGGDFTTLASKSGATTYARQYLAAFDATTGAVSTTFAPALNGQVNALLPGPRPGTVLVAGSFNTVNGVSNRRIVLLDVSDGSIVSSWKAPTTNGQTRDLKVAGNRLYVGGYFTTAGGAPHAGLVSLNYQTGALDPFVGNQFSVRHSQSCSNCASASTGVTSLDVSQDGSTLVAIGNFKVVDGLTRDQVVRLDLTGATSTVSTTWATTRYSAMCSRSFDSYMRDVEISPDGSYVMIVTTGAKYSNTLCDAAARFDLGATGTTLDPTWVDYAGGDTFLSVEITGQAIYVGGHFRWLNNDNGADTAGSGAVSRAGIAALDPLTGRPLAWNPGRHPRGYGVTALLATPSGLWMGSDTDWIGPNNAYYRPKIAFFPLAGGSAVAAGKGVTLPGNVYVGGMISGNGTTLSRRYVDGTTVTGDLPAPANSIDWSKVRGAFQVDGTLYYGVTDGVLHQTSFDGNGFGPSSNVDPYHDPVWCLIDTGSGTSKYCGVNPSLYGQLSSVTAMTYANGKLFYTLSGQTALYWRWFGADSGTLGANASTVPSTTLPSGSPALLVADGFLYYGNASNGNLSRVAFNPATGTSGTATTVSGPTIDGQDWRARAVFTGPGTKLPATTMLPPTAAATVSCVEVSCTFDGSGSTDPDGALVSYAWDFGDGSSGSGVSAQHTYADAQQRTAVLTVIDDQGLTSTAQVTASPSAPPTSTDITFVGAARSNANTASAKVVVPATVKAGDGLVLFATSASGTPTMTTPAGWTADAQDGTSGIRTQVYRRVATASDAGSTVTVALSGQSKTALDLVAYRGVAAGDFVTATSATAGSGTARTAPAAAIGVTGSWVLSYWSDKSAATTTSWTVPGALTVRGEQYGSGGGSVSSVVADTAGPMAAGTTSPARTATSNAAGNQATAWTLVLAPDSAATAAAPKAAFDSSCIELTCSFDASASTTGATSIDSYAWSFGDDAVTTTHSWAGADTRDVTLTITDSLGRTDSVTHPVTTTAPPATAAISFVAGASSSSNVSAAKVVVPSSVQAGDGLVLVITVNSATATVTDPTGWTKVAQDGTSGITTRVYRRVALASDAASTVTAALSTTAKTSVDLAAYRGVTAGDFLTAVSATAGSGTARTTPSAPIAVTGSWVASYWTDKSSGTSAWTVPGALTVRQQAYGSGGGAISSIWADSGSPLSAGTTAPARTATSDVTGNQATAWTFVLTPAG